MARLPALVDVGVVTAKFDRLTRSVKDLCLLAGSLDTGSAGRALGAEHFDGCKPMGTRGDRRPHRERVGNIQFGFRLYTDGKVEPGPRRTVRSPARKTKC